MTMRRTRFDAIGTKWDIQIQDKLSEDDWLALLQKLYVRIQAFDKAYSRFRSDSLVTQLAEQGGRHELPADGYKLLEFYERLYRATDGKVTPLIGQAMVDAGYDADYSLESGELTPPPLWDDSIAYSYDAITLKQPALLDFGAAGKGYLVDIVAGVIAAAGVEHYLVNAGGDIINRLQGGLLRVGMENPRNTTEVIGIVELGSRSLCGSSGSKRAWGDFHHIIDPEQLAAATDVLATWVIANDTMTADGLATALFFVDPSRLSANFQFEYAILYPDMSLQQTPQFNAQTFGAEA